MRKRLLAMLIALMLVVGLLPVGVLAAGDIWDGYGTFSYHISNSNLQAMVDAYNKPGASSGVDSVSITFDEVYTLSGQKTFLFRNGYTIGLSNTSKTVQPDDIDYLTITLINDTEFEVPGDALDWTWVNTSPKRYDLRLKNSDKSTVTFYYPPGGSYTYEEYTIVEVDSGTALNERMPADPTDLGGYKFVGWEIGSFNGDGREFHADTIVSEDIAVYARKISVEGGSRVDVINLNNSVYTNAYEHFNTESLEITGIALNGGGKSTNPNYDSTPGTGEWGADNGWRDDDSYYYIYNQENHTLPVGGKLWTDRVNPYSLDSITIFTTAGDYNIPRDELDVRVKDDTKVEIYLREATEPDTPVEPERPDEPTTNPDVSGVGIVVDCKTNDEHDKTVAIIEGSYTFNKAWDEEQWTCTVEVSPEFYVDDTHTLTPESQTGELLYVYAGGSWQYVGGSTPTVTFTVECETTEPGPVAKLNVDKTVAIPDGKDTAAVGDVLEYTVTISSLNGVAAGDVVVTDTMWESDSSVKIGGKDQYVTAGEDGYYVTVDVPANDSVDIYYTYTVPETDAGKTVGNTVTVGEMNVTTYTTVDEAEEPEDPGKPSEPTEDELNQLYVDLECINEDAQHAEKRFHLDQDNSYVIVDFTTGICTVEPMYDFILDTYNDQVADGHTYADDAERTLLLSWNRETKAWDVAGDVASITRQVKCETPEQKTQPVMLFIYQNGDTESAVKTIKLEDVVVGGQYRTTEDALNELVKEHYIPGKGATGEYVIEGYYNDGGWNQYRAGNKDNKLDLTQPITVNNGWYNIHVMVTDYEKVQIVIYRDGDTMTPYKTIPLANMLKGDTLDISTLGDISTYYTKEDMNKFATGFDYEGWFNDGAWNKYKNAGCPADAAGLDEIYINGWTNVIAMVWDQFPVNYNIVDENGTLVEEKIYTDTITERDLEDYTFYDASRTGYTFDGWYQDEKDVGDASKLLTGLNKAKKWELYGRYDPIPYNLVIYAAIDKDKDNAVEIYSGMVDYGTPLVACLETLDLKTDVFPGYSPEDGKWYKYDSPKWTFGENDTVSGWTNVLINYVPNEYTIYYHGNGGLYKGEHDQVSSHFKYGSTATIKNNEFERAGYVFEGWALSADGEVVYTGSEEVPFTEEYFPGLLENGKVEFYAVWAEDKLGGGDDGESPDGIPDYKQLFVKYTSADSSLGSVSPACETFTLEVDESGKVLTDPVTLSGAATTGENAQFAYWTITGPGYEGGAYSYDADLKSKAFSGYFAGETYTFTAYFTEDIVKPEPGTYTIKVEVINGTAEFMDTNIGAYNEIVAAADEDITIAFTPDEGYEFDYVYVDGVWSEIGADGKYTFENVSSNHSIKVAYKQESVPVTPIIPLPTVDEIAELIDSKIIVDCVNVDAAHADKSYGLIDGALVKVAMTDSTTVKVTLSANVYLAQYNDDDASAKHSLASGQSATVTFTLKYVDSKWTLPADAGELPATIKVVCDTPAAPNAPTEDELKALFDGKVLVDCVAKSWHPTNAYGLLADGYTVAGSVQGEDGEYTCTVTLLASAYLAEYNDDVTDKHTLASYQSNETVALKWTGSAWAVINGALPVTFDVVCDTWYPPIIPPVEPEEPDYTPNWLNTTDHFGYIIGYEDGTVKPNAGITRAEVATIFFRLLTDEARERFWCETNDYSDVADGSWYNNAVSTLSNMGILGGYEDGTFRPNASITRAEFAKIAVSFFDWADIEAVNDFVDVSDSAWYADYVAVAAEIGLIEGYGGNVFRPEAAITRAEACAIINRTLGRAPDAEHLLPESQMNTWPDNSDTGVWYYAHIQEATNSHDYSWIGDIEQWTEKLPEIDWDKFQY